MVPKTFCNQAFEPKNLKTRVLGALGLGFKGSLGASAGSGLTSQRPKDQKSDAMMTQTLNPKP